MEVAQEQQGAKLYKGFLVPPIKGEVMTEEVQATDISIKDVRAGIEKLSQTRLLSKHRVEALLWDEDDYQFLYLHCKGLRARTPFPRRHLTLSSKEIILQW